MSRTLTVRLSSVTLRQIQARARSLGVSASELMRRLVTDSVGASGAEPTAYELTRRSVGGVSSAKVPHGRDARSALAGWKPDRRG